MSEHAESQPPVAVEQWLDLVIASAAHRSHDAGHQKFGEALIHRYFVTVPERYRDDPVASRYFDDMLCAVAAAVRGFSVVRDVFQTNWDAAKTAREAAKQQLDRLESFSPLRKEGYWGKALGAVTGLGLSTVVLGALGEQWSKASLVTIVVVAAGVVIGLVLLEAFVEWQRGRQAHRIEQRLPTDLLAYWEERSLKGYRMVIRQFLSLAVEITNRHYPDTCKLPDTEQAEAIVERHFAFKLKSQPKEVKDADETGALLP